MKIMIKGSILMGCVAIATVASSSVTVVTRATNFEEDTVFAVAHPSVANVDGFRQSYGSIVKDGKAAEIGAFSYLVHKDGESIAPEGILDHAYEVIKANAGGESGFINEAGFFEYGAEGNADHAELDDVLTIDYVSCEPEGSEVKNMLFTINDPQCETEDCFVRVKRLSNTDCEGAMNSSLYTASNEDAGSFANDVVVDVVNFNYPYVCVRTMSENSNTAQLRGPWHIFTVPSCGL